MATEHRIRLFAGKILKLLCQRNATLDIFLLETKDIARLKARFIKKKTGPDHFGAPRRMGEPNILSFPEPPSFPHPETRKKYLGEIYLNKDIVEKSPERAAPLLIHGILHLLGHSHGRKASAAKMERLEKKVFAQLFRVKRTGV
jgi:rRNA maturation RNase YbeY